MYTQFEADWGAKIKPSHLRKTVATINPMQKWFTNETSTVPVQTIPFVEVLIAEPDLNAMIRQLNDSMWHQDMQKKYPQLKEAYMEYMTKVFLTIDNIPH